MFTLADLTQGRQEKNQGNSTFLSYLTRKWDEIHEQGDIFRYKISSLQGKALDRYLIRLNPDRNTKRRQPEHIDSISQPFDKDRFNFTKASDKEVICTLKNNEEDTDVHSVLVNVSPISRNHCLLCPSIDKCLPQVATEESLELVIQLMFCAGDRSFRIGFNSLCGFASVNHLHYHLFIEEDVLPVETIKCDHLKGCVYVTKDYPVQGFTFEVVSENDAKQMSREIYKLINYFLDHSIAHNILLTFGEGLKSEGDVVRVFVWPRKSSVGAKTLLVFNVAVLELSGWIPIYDVEDYDNLQLGALETELGKWKVNNFENVCEEIKKLY